MVYLTLALLGLGCALWSTARTERKAERLAVFSSAAALVMLADWIAFGWFSLYAYRPHLVADPHVDSVWGEFLADIVFVPSLAVTLTEVLPPVAGIAAGTVIVSLLEVIMLRVGLFFQQGWSVWFTALGFPVYFWATYVHWGRLQQSGVKEWRAALLRVTLLFNVAALLTLYLRGTHFIYTQLAVVATDHGNQALGRFLTYPPVMLTAGLWVAANLAQLWTRLAVALGVMILINVVFAATGFQFFRPPWSIPADALAQTVAVLLAVLAEQSIHRLAGDGLLT